MKSFGSDNHAGVHPAVLKAVVAANDGDAVAYGEDALSQRAVARLCSAAGAQAGYLVFNGTAANVLGLSLMVRPFEAVICAETSHLNVDECGAPERALGTKLLTIPTPDGKLTAELIASRLTGRGDEHRAQPRVVQLAQATELGTCYTLGELARIREFCSEQGLLIYLDGARIGNAAAFLGCSLADLAAHADVLSFGGTKNGALGVEAVLVMAEELATDVQYQRKQLMQLASKMRFLAAQVEALVADDLWIATARHANAMAQLLAASLADIPGLRLAYPVEANGVFAEIGREAASELRRDWNFQVWQDRGPDWCIVRWMTAFDTTDADVATLADAIRAGLVSRETRPTAKLATNTQS
jgi:threonine aldolase